MPKKSFNEKLHSAGDLPKVEDLSGSPEIMKRMGGAKMLVASPMQYNEMMAQIPRGKIIIIDRIRAHLALQAGANTTCPLTAGIFTNICAHASEECDQDKIPWWRTLKYKGELNEKFPDGQNLLLVEEGHNIIAKGKRSFVQNYEDNLFALDSE